jgi:hypothetical protein
MRPSTRALIDEVAARYGVTPADILAHVKPRRLLAARIEIARTLFERGYNGPQIAKVLQRDDTMAYFYLGRMTNKHPKLRPPTPARPRRRRKREEPRRPIRYAGWDATEVHR